MLQTVWIIYNYNLYESKKYFTQKFAEAFECHGVHAKIIDASKATADDSKNFFQKSSPDLCCSFNRVIRNPNGKYFWEAHQLPYLSILVDPACYDAELIKVPYSIVSCVDRMDCDYLRSKGGSNILFLPHAVEKELAAEADQTRPYDVVFIGSSYDPDSLKQFWRKKFSAHLLAICEEAADKTLSEFATPFWLAVDITLNKHGIQLNETERIKIYDQVDQYVRGVDRLELIRSIKNASVHVFGGTCWRENAAPRGWGQVLADCPNVTVHPSIPFWETLNILKQSKICLNSMPFFKDGTHERIFTGLACGALVVTTENRWVKENFIDGKELLLYQSKQWDRVNEKVDFYLAHENERLQVVSKGRQKVMQNHTWDQRVEQLLNEFPSILKSFKDARNMDFNHK